MAVHDVDMKPVAGGVDGAHLLAELGEVGGQDRWGDGERAMHRRLRAPAYHALAAAQIRRSKVVSPAISPIYRLFVVSHRAGLRQF
jgi:hypothetical protein